MKRILPYILSLTIAVLTLACTHTGGPDGKLYGRWHLIRIEAEGTDASTPTRNMYWAFQSNMIMMQQERGDHEFNTSYGIFRLDDDTLFLNFPEAKMPPLAESKLKRESILQVLRMTHSEMTLLYNLAPEVTITYYFRKW
ncbi:MAG: lipocalin-like domain-containing protein [Muribaculaceae bacterium]|nr:lipocalin-like domain-containing protein [Muribaculaceae bacterium]